MVRSKKIYMDPKINNNLLVVKRFVSAKLQ